VEDWRAIFLSMAKELRDVLASAAGAGPNSAPKLRCMGTRQNSWARLRGRDQWHGNC
jgi:hypothetical protein